MNVVEHMTIYF